ncbi:MAG: hypothetical protein WC496_04770 [Phycisphaerae bacterium]|jgi:hypothetical protein
MKHFNSKIIFCALAILAVSSFCMAETVIEKFKPDSVLTKVTEPNSSALFSYSPEGYTACTVRRSNLGGTAAKYFKPLSQNYYMPDINSVATVSDVWFGFDFKYDPASAGVAAGYIGVYNSAASNTTVVPGQLNCISLMPYDLDKFTLRVENNNADGTSSLTETGLGAVINSTDSFRCKVHVYMSGSDSLADVEIYSVDSLNQTSLLTSTTGITVAVGKTFWAGVNALGVRNVAGTDNIAKSVFYVDNMYFSTTGVVADGNLAAPGWLAHDDPNTLYVDNLDSFEDFRPNPVDSNEWAVFAQIESGCGFGYDANGAYYCAIRRKNVANSVAALYKPIPKLYEPFNYNGFKFWSADEVWFGFDYHFISGTTAATFTIGLFNAESTNISGQNCLGFEFHSGTAVALRVIGNTTWAASYQSEPTVGYYSDTYGSYRFKVRLYADEVADKTFIDVECYKFNDANGVLPETPEFTSTAVVVADGTLGTPQKFLEGLNAFGVRNNSGSSSSPSRFNVDNMYISTEAPFELKTPSWLFSDADLNHDKAVDMLDLAIIATDWLSNNNAADIDNSGRVELGDYGIFANYWGL